MSSWKASFSVIDNRHTIVLLSQSLLRLLLNPRCRREIFFLWSCKISYAHFRSASYAHSTAKATYTALFSVLAAWSIIKTSFASVKSMVVLSASLLESLSELWLSVIAYPHALLGQRPLFIKLSCAARGVVIIHGSCPLLVEQYTDWVHDV